MDDDTKAAGPLTPDEERALREAWACIGAWEPWDGQEPGATYKCPLCDGEGETEGAILDATKPFAATLGAYGIGPGLAAAELVAGSTGRLLATVDAVRRERDAAVEALAELRAAAGTVISDLHRANQLGPCGEVRQVAQTQWEEHERTWRDREVTKEDARRAMSILLGHEETVDPLFGASPLSRAIGRVCRRLEALEAEIVEVRRERTELAVRTETLESEIVALESALESDVADVRALETEIVEVRREKTELAERVDGAVARADLLRDVAKHEREVYAYDTARIRDALGLDASASISDVVKRAEELAARGER